MALMKCLCLGSVNMPTWRLECVGIGSELAVFGAMVFNLGTIRQHAYKNLLFFSTASGLFHLGK